MTNGEKMRKVFPNIKLLGESKDTWDYCLGGMIHRIMKNWWNAEYKEPCSSVKPNRAKSIDEVIKTIKTARAEVEWEYPMDYAVAFDVALKALEKQKELAEYSGHAICEWFEDYDYDDNNISEYQFAANVDDFLIDEVNGEEQCG